MNADQRRFKTHGRILRLVCFVLVATSTLGQSQAPPCDPNVSARLRKLPVASDAWKKIQDMQLWKNPYIIIQRDGILLLVGGVRNYKTIAVEDLARTLAELPKTAWPLGRVIGVQENGLRSGDDDVLIAKNRVRVAGILGCLPLQVTWVS